MNEILITLPGKGNQKHKAKMRRQQDDRAKRIAPNLAKAEAELMAAVARRNKAVAMPLVADEPPTTRVNATPPMKELPALSDLP